MTGVFLGVAMLVSSAGVSPAQEPAHAAFSPPAFTLQLPDEATMARWARAVPATTQAVTKARRHSMTDRIIAVAAGGTLGFLGGAYIGGSITDRSKENPDDDTSVLKGVFIGAPIGAVIGGIAGWMLTRN